MAELDRARLVAIALNAKAVQPGVEAHAGAIVDALLTDLADDAEALRAQYVGSGQDDGRTLPYAVRLRGWVGTP